MTIDQMIAVLQAAKEGKTILDSEGRIANMQQRCALQCYRVNPDPLETALWVSERGSITETDMSSCEGWTKKKFREVIE